jgi:predicted nuclease of predicted toxin-antitoxin system
MREPNIEALFLMASALDSDIEEFLSIPINKRPKIGELLLKQGIITEKQLDKAVKIRNKKIGEILVEHKYITPKQLQKAMEKQKSTIGTKLQ